MRVAVASEAASCSAAAGYAERLYRRGADGPDPLLDHVSLEIRPGNRRRSSGRRARARRCCGPWPGWTRWTAARFAGRAAWPPPGARVPQPGGLLAAAGSAGRRDGGDEPAAGQHTRIHAQHGTIRTGAGGVTELGADESFLNRTDRELSGGESQLVACLRAWRSSRGCCCWTSRLRRSIRTRPRRSRGWSNAGSRPAKTSGRSCG